MHYSRTASGDIWPCRFVTLDKTAQGCVRQAGDCDLILGVSGKDTHFTPIFDEFFVVDDGKHAKAGEPCFIYGPGGQEGMEILVQVGGQAVFAGDRLKSDADGKAVPAGATDDAGAIAISGSLPSDMVRAQLIYPSNACGSEPSESSFFPPTYFPPDYFPPTYFG